jgi:hypothetical protein
MVDLKHEKNKGHFLRTCLWSFLTSPLFEQFLMTGVKVILEDMDNEEINSVLIATINEAFDKSDKIDNRESEFMLY